MKTNPRLRNGTGNEIGNALRRREFLIGSVLAVGGFAWADEGEAKRLRIGFAGLKHGHVFGVMKIAAADPRVSIVALADDDEQNKKEGERVSGKPVRHANYREMLGAEGAQLDAVVVGEEYGRRGEAAIAALEAGKHVFSDKPLCTRTEELQRIAALAAEKRREVHVDFSLRHMWAKAAAPLQQGEIGDIVSCTFVGPHSLGYDRRPKWYYTPELHGGVINDLMGHGVDFVHWITRKRYAEVLSATKACVGLPQQPTFETYGDAHYCMEGGASVFGEVDYLVQAGHPSAWRCNVQGTKGDAIVGEREGFILRPAGAAERQVAAKELRAESPSPFEDFVSLLIDGTAPLRTTAESLHGSLATLIAQEAAETGKGNLRLSFKRRDAETQRG